MSPDHTVKSIKGITVDRDALTLDFELDEEATVSGEVVDEHGQPVAGAIVHQGELEATSDSDGTFTLHAIGAGRVEVGVRGTSTSLKVDVKTNTDAISNVRLVVKR
jgi:uncharacterized membrane protein